MDRAVLLADKMHVIGRDDFHAVFFRQFEEDLVVDHLVVVNFPGQAGDLGLVQHDLEVVILPEHPLVPLDGLVCGFHVSGEDGARHFPGHAGRRTDQVFMVAFNDLVTYSRAVVHALDVGRGDDLHQVPVAVVVLGQEDEMVVPLFLDPVVALGHVDLAADDRLDAGMFLGILEELLHPVHVAVVRDGKAGHAQLLGAVEQVFDGRLSVQDGILGMYVKVNEGHWDPVLGEQR